MKIRELREKNIQELKNLLDEERSKLSQVRFNLKSNQRNNYKEINKIKKIIARLLTLIREKELEYNK